MAVTQEHLDGYGLWALCDEVKDMIAKAIKNVDRAEFNTLHRLSEALIAVAVLRHIPAWRFPNASSAEALHAQIESVKTPLQNLIDDPEASIKDQVEEHLEQIALQLLNCPTNSYPPEHLTDLSGLTEKYKDGIANAIDRARQVSADVEEELQKVVESKDKALADLAHQLEDLQASIASEKADVTAQAARLDTALTTNNTAFTTRMTAWQESWDQSLKEARKLAEQQIYESGNTAEGHVERLTDLEKQSR